jgi:hypothetical protein
VSDRVGLRALLLILTSLLAGCTALTTPEREASVAVPGRPEPAWTPPPLNRAWRTPRVRIADLRVEAGDVVLFSYTTGRTFTGI